MDVKLGVRHWGKNMGWECLRIGRCWRLMCVYLLTVPHVTASGLLAVRFDTSVVWVCLVRVCFEGKYNFSLTSPRDFEIKMLITLIGYLVVKSFHWCGVSKVTPIFCQFNLFFHALRWFLFLNIYSLVVCLLSKFSLCFLVYHKYSIVPVKWMWRWRKMLVN